MSVSPPRSPRNPNPPAHSGWRVWSAAVPAVLAGTLAGWMFDWAVGIGVASSVLTITRQLIQQRTST